MDFSQPYFSISHVKRTSLSAIAFAMFHMTEQFNVCRLCNEICSNFPVLLLKPEFPVSLTIIVTIQTATSEYKKKNSNLAGVFLDLINGLFLSSLQSILQKNLGFPVVLHSPMVPAALFLEKNGY